MTAGPRSDEPRPAPERRWRRARRGRWVLAPAAVVVAGVAVLASGTFGSGEPPAGDAPAGGSSLATVERGRLTSQVLESGTLGHAARPDGSPFVVVNAASGTYTRLPDAGDTVGCGEPLLRVDERPVVLLCGSVAAYRRLSQGMSGPDVRILNRNLVRLGYATRSELDPGSETFGAATEAALTELQEDRGLPESGVLELGDVVFLPGPVRIERTTATLGARARPGEPVAQATSTRRQVTVQLGASQRSGVTVGDPVRITLPGNRTTHGRVQRIGVGGGSADAAQEGSTGSSADEPSDAVPVQIALRRPQDVRGLDGAPVEVEITTGRVADALSVPVTALVAQAGGGYAVERQQAGRPRELVPVKLGMFDQGDGIVEITGAGIRAGQRVVIPSS